MSPVITAVWPSDSINTLTWPGVWPVVGISRTSGEMRLSNFLLFEAAYAELAFLDALWPDVGVADLEGVLRDFAGRERRYGRGE